MCHSTFMSYSSDSRVGASLVDTSPGNSQRNYSGGLDNNPLPLHLHVRQIYYSMDWYKLQLALLKKEC